MNSVPKQRRDSNSNSPQGGQASLGMFGLPGSSRRRFTAVAALAMPKCWQQPGTPERHTLTIRADKLAPFQRLSEREQRPVEEVIEEWLASCAAKIEREEEEAREAATRKNTTAAMRWVAFYADQRERQPEADLEEWDRSLPFGQVESALASA